MTQKSNFLGKQTKITVSLRIGLRGKISQQQQIKLLFAPKESTRACRSILYSAFPPLVELSNSIRSSFEAKHSSFRASWSQFQLFTLLYPQPAWPALKGEGERGMAFLSFPPRAPHTLSRAPKFPFPLPLSTPATQAIVSSLIPVSSSGGSQFRQIISIFPERLYCHLVGHRSASVPQLKAVKVM